MQGSARVLESLNDLLTLELTAVNQYFNHSKLCEHWGYKRLADKIRQDAFDEMKDAEEIIERILFLEGIPNMQRLGAVSVGETVGEILRLQLQSEKSAVKLLGEAVSACVEEGDNGTREFLAKMVEAEERHIAWLETQIELIEQIGESNYLTQQIRD